MKVGVAGRHVRARGRRRADAGRVPRRGAGGRRASSTARPGALEALAGCDVACVHNTVTYPPETVEALAGKPVLRYWHDLARPGSAGRRAAAALGARARDQRLHLAAAPRRASRTRVAGETRADPARDRRSTRYAGSAAQAAARRVLAGLRPARRQGARAGVRVGRGERAGRLLGRRSALAEIAAGARQGPGPARPRRRRSCGSTSASSSSRRTPSRSGARRSRRGRRAAS